MPPGSGGNFDGTQGSREVVIASVRRTRLSLPPFENGCKTAVKESACIFLDAGALWLVAEPTGLEPATSDVTGRRSNQLNYDSARTLIFKVGAHVVGTEGFEPPTSTL